ncbi:MAG: PIN domain-containing protein [Nitrososphaeraceae archaeon]
MSSILTDKNKLVEKFDTNLMDIKYVPKGLQVNKFPDLEVCVYCKDILLYTWSFMSGNLKILSPDIFRTEVIELMDRTGLLPLEVEFNSPDPGLHINVRDSVKKIDLQNIRDFATWFDMICSNVATHIYLILDTNILRRLYYSNFLNNIITYSRLKDTLKIMIPRLCILEIENKYNRSSKKEREDMDQKKDNDLKVFTEVIKGKEKRLGLLSIKEVISIKKNGGLTNPKISTSLLESFSRASGTNYADHWIRKEIMEFNSTLHGIEKRNANGEYHLEKSNGILVTCDIMNSLVSVSENINTLYIIRKENPELKVNSPSLFASLVYNTAIQFGECTCQIRYHQEETFNVIGMWKGKTTYDWLTDKILVNDQPTIRSNS